ncbi:hypothetical protein ABT247_25630 [Kitasatospora sp. NPDC001539]|uniref:hypothetical protein n=1 Tax=Kitasatospora sp. NPDC001539 TaxID=3154384 RepID=UPI00333308C8
MAVDVRGSTVRFGVVLLGLVLGACACSGVSGGEGASSDVTRGGSSAAEPSPTSPSVSTSTVKDAAGVTPRPTFPESIKRQVVRMAEEAGRMPVGGEFSLAEYDGGYGPELIWRTERTGEICTAQMAGPSTTCATLASIPAKHVPGVDVFMGGGQFSDHGQTFWAVTLIANGESVDHLVCRGRDFPVRAAYSTRIDGIPRTIYTVVIPQELQGEYRVVVQRDGHQAEERLDLNLEKVGSPAPC